MTQVAGLGHADLAAVRDAKDMDPLTASDLADLIEQRHLSVSAVSRLSTPLPALVKVTDELRRRLLLVLCGDQILSTPDAGDHTMLAPLRRRALTNCLVLETPDSYKPLYGRIIHHMGEIYTGYLIGPPVTQASHVRFEAHLNLSMWQ